MIRYLTLLLLTAAALAAQISGAGQIGCTGAPVTGTVWNSGTSQNTTQTLLTNSAAWGAIVQLDQTSTITAGAITFEISYDGTNFVNLPAGNLSDPLTRLPMANPYTLVASTNQPFFIKMVGGSNIRLKLTTAITGTGAVTPYTTAVCMIVAPLITGRYNSTLPTITDGQSTPFQQDAKGQMLVDLNYVGGSAVATGTGAGGAGIPRVTISNDSSLAANQSTNVNQFGGSAVVTGTGAGGAGIPRVTISNDSSLAANQSVNVAQVAGGTTSTVATGVQKVGIADSAGTAFLSAANALNSTGGGIQTAQLVGQFDDTTPTSITENQFGNLRMSANRNLFGTIRDAAGNERGVNVTAGNAIQADLTSVAGTTTLTGNGVTGAGSQRVTIASDSTAHEVIPVATATTTNGASTYHLTSAASTNATNVKSSAGNVYGIRIINTTATLSYLRLYNSSGSPTCSSATGFVESIPVPASTSGAGIAFPQPIGQAFGTGIAFCWTGGGSSTDNTATVTGQYLTILYK